MESYPMHRAAEAGVLVRVRQLIEGGYSSVDSRDGQGRTSLHWAAEQGLYEVAKLLIDRECDLNPKDHFNLTPLCWAAFKGREDVVGLLLESGAQIDTSRFEDTPLMWAARKGHKDVAALLIRAGADINRRSEGNKKNKTALHLAAGFGFAKVVQVLLENKRLDLNPQDGDGETPLHWVLAKRLYLMRHLWIVIKLLEAGADPNIKNYDGKTAVSLHIVQRYVMPEVIKLCVFHGAFLEEFDYVLIFQNPFLKENVLKDVDCCTQSLINKFHHQSLPTLYRNHYFARNLPPIGHLKLNARQIDEVENLVKCQIEKNTFCNVVKVHPMALSSLCVLSLATLPGLAWNDVLQNFLTEIHHLNMSP